MKKYIGFKMIEAERATRSSISKNVYPHSEPMPDMVKINSEEGYKVVYPDGYVSWSPKEVFEKAYMQVGDNNTIVETNVHDFVKDIECMKWGEKTTIANATLTNGFIITVSSSCVDPANYNQDIGESICKEQVYNQVWKMLGFLLQSAKYGVKG